MNIYTPESTAPPSRDVLESQLREAQATIAKLRQQVRLAEEAWKESDKRRQALVQALAEEATHSAAQRLDFERRIGDLEATLMVLRGGGRD